MNPWAKRALTIVAAMVLHEALARGLDRAGLIERLLSPSGGGAVVALVAAVALYALRFGLLFVVPGVVVARALIDLIERRRRRLTLPDDATGTD